MSTDSILGVVVKSLKSFPDDRGFFREIVRSSEEIFVGGEFLQWSHSRMQKNVVKAWHYHHLQTDWWYVATGKIEAVLYDKREESPTYGKKMIVPMGEETPVCVRIPPGVLHGLHVQSEFADLLYVTSRIYDPQDEGRYAYNSPDVPHRWPENVITVERDRKDFVPVAVRKKCV